MDELLPEKDMIISVRMRRDVKIVDPQRFLAAARQAYRDLNPEADEDEAADVVTDVRDAVFALLDRFGQLAPDSLAVSGSQWDLDRADGMAPEGFHTTVVFDDPMTLREHGNFLPADPFALPADHQD